MAPSKPRRASGSGIPPIAKTIAAAALWIIVWQVLACCIQNQILIAGPIDVMAAIAGNCTQPAFWSSIGFSLARIFIGFALAFMLALTCALIAWKSSLFETLLQPLVTFVKSVPVVCIIVLLLVWTGAANVSIIAVALMVFPPVYFSTLEGLKQTSDDMRQMLDVFRIAPGARLRYYYLPTVMPYVVSASRVVVGIAWKSGIAAEVIGIPLGSIGAQIYAAKIGLNTADLFAWTVVVVMLSALCEKGFLAALSAIESLGSSVKPKPRTDDAATFEPMGIALCDMSFSYGETDVIQQLTHSFDKSSRSCLMAPSGSGKTTLLDLCCGLIPPTQGTVALSSATSRSFQDDRLLAKLSAWDNVSLVCALGAADRDLLKFDLDEMIGCDSATLAIDECSGGMRRKVSLARALGASSGAVLLDEPFAGMDDVSRVDAVAFINRHLHGRTLVVATHDHDDVTFLDAQLVRL